MTPRWQPWADVIHSRTATPGRAGALVVFAPVRTVGAVRRTVDTLKTLDTTDEVEALAPTSRQFWARGPATGQLEDATVGCVHCAAESLRAFRLVEPGERPRVESPEQAADLVVPALRHRDREHCVAALLDTKHRLIDLVTVSVGSIDHTFMSPREVFRDALLANATAIVVAHNHPSGDTTPSKDDEAITRRLARAGEIVGVALLDHLVTAGDHWTSLARRGAV